VSFPGDFHDALCEQVSFDTEAGKDASSCGCVERWDEKAVERMQSAVSYWENESRPHPPGVVQDLKQAVHFLATERDHTKTLRRLLWLRHGCPLPALYGDDGEMSCGRCGIDFLRWKPVAIHNKFTSLGMEKLAQETKTGPAPGYPPDKGD